jgi:hypothetical protein
MSIYIYMFEVDFEFLAFDAARTQNQSAVYEEATIGPTGDVGGQGHFGLVLLGHANVRVCPSYEQEDDRHMKSVRMKRTSHHDTDSYLSIYLSIYLYIYVYIYIYIYAEWPPVLSKANGYRSHSLALVNGHHS